MGKESTALTEPLTAHKQEARPNAWQQVGNPHLNFAFCPEVDEFAWEERNNAALEEAKLLAFQSWFWDGLAPVVTLLVVKFFAWMLVQPDVWIKPDSKLGCDMFFNPGTNSTQGSNKSLEDIKNHGTFAYLGLQII